MNEPFPRRWFFPALIAITLLAAGLRLYRLGHAGLWIDELWTIRACGDLSQMHLSKILGYIPTYFGLVASGADLAALNPLSPGQWADLGITPTSMRLGSCIVGILTIPILAIASLGMLGRGAALLAALLLAVSPWHIYWSQAARFYTLEFLFYTLSLIVYFGATERGSRPRFVLAMIFMVLAFLSQPPALVILPVFAADWLVALLRRQPLPIRLFEWAAGIAAVGLCALILALDVSHASDQWAEFVGLQHGKSAVWPVKLAMGVVYMTGPVVITAALFSALWLYPRRPRLAVYLLAAGGVPVILLGIWSLKNTVGHRYLFVCLYAYIALASLGAVALTRLLAASAGRLAAAAPVALLLASHAFLLLAYYTAGHGFHPRMHEAFDYIRAHARPGDMVAMRHPYIAAYYLRRDDVRVFPESAQELAAIGPRVWLPNQSETTDGSTVAPWMLEITDLRLSLDLRVPQPAGLVEVYLYDAARAAPPAP